MPGLLDFARRRIGQALHALEVVEQADEAGRGDHRHSARPTCLGALAGRTDQALFLLARVKRGEQHAR
ncbi:hypothetical protein D3C83_283190 [compost metagenome]